MASILTPRGRLYYHPKFVYLGMKKMVPKVAFDNLKDLIHILEKFDISVSPAFGTLLGIIRENWFIEWDEDIDMFILKEDRDKFLCALWDLNELGFELIRNSRAGHLYSIMRNGEYIDFYIMEPISPKVRTTLGGGFVFEKYLTDLIDWDFNSLKIKVPRDYEECLEFMYGDWRTPVQYADFDLNKWEILKVRITEFIKGLLPNSLHIMLLKKYHQKEMDKFLAKCAQKGINIK